MQAVFLVRGPVLQIAPSTTVPLASAAGGAAGPTGRPNARRPAPRPGVPVDLQLMVPEYRKKTLSHREILNATSAFMV